MRIPGRELQTILGEAIPSDHSRQTLAEHYIELGLGLHEGRPWRVLDLGCGTGSSVDFFRARDPSVEWTGVDLERSREVDERVRADARFVSFDGVSLPFEDGRFDLVYCKQVLEHVRHPSALLTEVSRVLRPHGFFAGSTSQLEPFHSTSFWNYTPLGFAELLTAAGMKLTEIRPGIDAPALLSTRLTGTRRVHARWWGNRSPLNALIDGWGRARGLDAQTVNATKLLFCGQFTFAAQRA